MTTTSEAAARDFPSAVPAGGADRDQAGGAAGTRTVLLVAHTGRPDIGPTAGHVRDRLAAAGIALVALDPEAAELELPVVRAAAGTPSPVELVLTLGGDGTLLRGAEEARAGNAPVLGINLGRVGFLTETDAAHLDSALDAVIARDYLISERMTVEMTVEHDGSRIAEAIRTELSA